MNDITFFIFAVSVWVLLYVIIDYLKSIYEKLIDMSIKVTVIENCSITASQKDIYTQVRNALK